MSPILVCTECGTGCLLLPGDPAEYCDRGWSYEDVLVRREAEA